MPSPLVAAVPYALPYLGFLLVIEVARWTSGTEAAWLLPVRVAVPAVLLGFFLLRRAYAELQGLRRLGAGIVLDVAMGLLILATWTLPYLVVEALPRPGPEAAFDAAVLGTGRETLALLLRGLGFVVLTPLVEELFVRGLLWRWLAAEGEGDFREVPPAAPSRRAAIGTTLFFTITHLPWEWPVALPTGALLALWLLWRRHLGACIVAHAVANGGLFALVVLRPERFGFFL